MMARPVKVCMVAVAMVLSACAGRVAVKPNATGRDASQVGCRAAHFRVRLRELRDGIAGQTQVLTLTNLGPGSCRLDGVPRLTLLDVDGRVVFRPPQTVANHGLPVELAADRFASVWLDLLAQDGLSPPGAAQLEVQVNGIRGPIRFRPPAGDLAGQQLIVSAVALGSITGLPASIGVAPHCRALTLVGDGQSLGVAAGHSVGSFTVRNVGKAPCSVGGFPRLSIEDVDGRLRYWTPEDHAGASALIQLAPGATASAWALYPDCGAFGVGPSKPIPARQSVGLLGVRPIIEPRSWAPAAWPTSRCVVTVSGLAGGVFRIGPGFSTGGLPPPAIPRPAEAICQTHDLRIREVRSGGAGGSFYLGLSYRNVTRASCKGTGIPRVVLIGRDHRVLGVARRFGHTLPKLIAKPGDRIYEQIQYGENPPRHQPCITVQAARISLPGSTQASLVPLPVSSAYCIGTWIEAFPLASSVMSSLSDG
jgi:hypothetical protein